MTYCFALLFEHTTSISNAKPGQAIWLQLDLESFEPIFEQKGVDMRIGLDIAAYSDRKAVDRIILVSADTDCVPALKYGRRAGLQTVLIEPDGARIPPELMAHADFTRSVPLP